MNATQDLLKRQQAACMIVETKMLEALMGFEPTQKLTVSDVKFIASWARQIAFDAIKECEVQS